MQIRTQVSEEKDDEETPVSKPWEREKRIGTWSPNCKLSAR